MAVLERIDRYRGTGSFAAWLFAIARRRCQDLHRKRGRRREESPLPDMADETQAEVAGHHYESELMGCIRQRLKTMTAERQDVIRLRFWAGLNTKETAKVMGKGQSAVKMLLSRAVADLRERCLDE